MAYLELKNVSKTFASVTAVHDFNLDIEKGEFISLMGPSGAGKSTLTHHVLGNFLRARLNGDPLSPGTCHEITGFEGISKLIEKRSDAELAALMNNLGGHDLPSLLDAFKSAHAQKPTCFICYTVKGFGLPMAGHKDNHAGLMTAAQMEKYRAAMNVRPGHEWDKLEGLARPAEELQAFLSRVPFAQGGDRRLKSAAATRT